MNDTTDFYFQWHITNVCNHRCKHCYHQNYDNSNELSIGQLIDVATSMHEALEKWEFKASLSLTGGEPFTRKEDLFALMDYIENNCARFVDYDILTNGTMIADEDFISLKKYKKLRRVQVSLEGATPMSHDTVRGEGDFMAVTNAIKKLKQNGFKVSVMTTLTKNNKEELPNMISLLGKLSVDYFSLERFMPEGQGEEHKGWLLTKEEVREVFQYMTNMSKHIKTPHLLLYRALYCLCDGADETVGAMCSAGVNALTILPDATVLPCRRLPLPIGNVLTDGIINIWYSSDILWNLRNYRGYKGKCNGCEHFLECRGCRSMAYLSTGDYLQEDPQCWK